MSAIDCTEFHHRAPELALGLLGGDERADAVEHLARCAGCGVHLQELMRVADLLLQLPPPVEPDVGFESRTMGRLASEGAFSATPAAAVESTVSDDSPDRAAAAPVPGRPAGPSAPAPIATRRRRPRARPASGPRSWPRLLAVAAAVVIVAAAAVIGVAAGRNNGRASAFRVQATTVNLLGMRAVAVRADGGRSLCQLVAFPAAGSHPARVVVHLDEPGDAPDSYQVFAEPTDGGPPVRLGMISMVAGQGTLAASVPAGTGPVHAVQVVEAPNTVKYRATFASV